MLKFLWNRFGSAALLICAVVLGWTGVAHSDPRLWDNAVRQDRNGRAIRQGHHIEWQRASYRRADGYVLVVWSDCRNGDRDIYGQLISPTGNEMWTHDGRAIVSFPYRQEDPEVTVASDGNWIVAWIDFRFDSTGDVYAQKLTDSGTRLWADTAGVVVDTFICSTPGCGSAVSETTLRAVGDANGGAIIAWEDTRRDPAGDIYAQHINANGVRTWNNTPYPPLAVTYIDGGQNGITADADGNGNMLVAWKDGRDASNQNVYAAKITADGQLPWGGQNGMVVCNADGQQSSPKLCPDGLGGAYVAWTDQRNTTDDVYVQRINGAGDVQWTPNGVPLSDAEHNQGEVRVATSANGLTPDGLLAVWEDQRVNGERKEVFAQKMSLQGAAQWQANGLRVCGNAGQDSLGPTGETRDGVRLISDFHGGLICAWEDTRGSDNDLQNCDIYGARVLANGTLTWGGECGNLLAGGPRAQNAPLIRMTDSTHFSMFYDDLRRGSQAIRYQRYDLASCTPSFSTDSTLVAGLDGDAFLPKTVAMAGGRAGVVWLDNRAVAGGTALYYQIIDSSGNVEKGVNGDTLVPDNSGNAQVSQDKHQVCTDNGGGFFVTFEDLRTGAKLIRLTHIGSDGQLLGNRAGSEIWHDAQTTDQVDAFCAPDGIGGCYVAWSNYNLSYLIDVYVMRMNSDCTPAWPQPVRLTNTDDDDMMRGLVSNPDHSAIMVWKSGLFGAFNITTAKVDLNGNVVYNFNVCDAPNEQDNPTLVSDGQGGAFYAWSDKRNEEMRPGFDKDIYAQHLSATGEELWQGHNGIPVVIDTLMQDKPTLALSQDGQLFCTWESFVGEVSGLNLMAQKLSPSGARQWPVLGKPLCLARGDQQDVVLYAEWGNGLYVNWTDNRVAFPDVYGMHWWAGGDATESWWVPDSGGVVCDYYQWQTNPSICDDAGGGIFTAWTDQRASGKEPLKNIWMNRINDHVTSIKEVPTSLLPTKPELYQNYPNPFNPSTRISFAIPATQRVSVEIFNTLGQKVTTLVDKVMTAGKYEIMYESPRLASGMYYYRLKTSNFVDVKKMILLK
ncbi:MAG TPA: T9SS type A sorting domain-containing protein [bacterium]|jgi:hypothetical protein